MIALLPAYLAILSVSNNVAQMIICTFANDDYLTRNLTARWRVAPIALSGSVATFETVDGTTRVELKWKDANAGSYSTLPLRGNGQPSYNQFVRLDG
jgi:hypothetical protein